MAGLRTTVAAAGAVVATEGTTAVLGMDLNNKIDLGQLIIAVSAICSICALIFTMRADLRSLKEALTKEMTSLGGRVSTLEEGQREISKAMVEVARQDERLGAIDARLRRAEENMERMHDDLAWARRVPEPVRHHLAPNDDQIGRKGEKSY